MLVGTSICTGTCDGPCTGTIGTDAGSHLDAGLLFALADSFNVSELELWLKKKRFSLVHFGNFSVGIYKIH